MSPSLVQSLSRSFKTYSSESQTDLDLFTVFSIILSVGT